MSKKHVIRVRNGFSDRNNISPISKEMQFKDFASDTRVVLFNVLKNNINYQINVRNLDTDYIVQKIVEDLFNEVYSKYRYSFEEVMKDIFDIFRTDEYHTVLTVIEYLCNLLFVSFYDFINGYHSVYYNNDSYIDIREEMNKAFEDEYVGYRFIDDKIVAITNDAEIESISNAEQTEYEKVNDSISKAIAFLSETGNKDYKNSIKESITAVEQLANIINGSKGLVLSNAIQQLCDKHIIDNDLKDTIKCLYKYASNVNGVRHGNNKENDCVTFEEAKFVLLLCSSSINYLCSVSKRG